MDYILKSSDERVVINDFIQGDPLSEENLDKTLELVSNLRRVDSANPCKMGISEAENPDEIRLLFPNKSIWIYSGYTWSDIWCSEAALQSDYALDYCENVSINHKKRQQIISKCTVMVDGRYIDSQRDVTLKWRGSKNQNCIDIQQSLQQNKIVLYCE